MTPALPSRHTLRSYRAVRRTAVALALVVFGLAAPARAVSVSDLVQLSKAGLSDDVLVALIEADNTVFNLDGPKIISLRGDGLSERVIVAMLKSGKPEPGAVPRTEPPAGAALAPEAPPPLEVVGDTPAPENPPEPVMSLVVPWVPAFGVPGHRPHSRPQGRTTTASGFGRFINDGWIDNGQRQGFGRFMNDGWVDRTPPRR